MTAGTSRSTPLGRRPYLGPSPRKVMTSQDLQRLRRAGFGAGRFDEYAPWLRIRRKFSSPVSNQQVCEVPFLGRHLHLLSRLEGQFALLASFLGALEVREQVPTHAEPDWHPGFDPQHRLEIPNSNRQLPGLNDIGEETGVDPGRYPGTNITFVMTTDLVLTVRDQVVNKLVYWPVKPLDDLVGPNATRRLERLRLEQRRSEHVGAFFHVMTDQTVSKQPFVENLFAFKPHAVDIQRFGQDKLHCFADVFNRCHGATLLQAWRESGSSAGLSGLAEARRMFDVALYSGMLDVDISAPMVSHHPVVWGGKEKRRRLRRVLFGVSE